LSLFARPYFDKREADFKVFTGTHASGVLRGFAARCAESLRLSDVTEFASGLRPQGIAQREFEEAFLKGKAFPHIRRHSRDAAAWVSHY
jgi:hypothetical protein